MAHKVYYNEFDKKKCAALKALMEDGHISEGDIDDRPIQQVSGSDLRGYVRCHFFAGIGLWDYALDLAGWEEDKPVWTGSAPCQPFSTAGRQKGKADNRHLWPQWLRLIQECNPPVIFGEQVNAAITQGWLDEVYQGLEAEDYAIGSAVLPACSVGAPHRRERLWFVANSDSYKCKQPKCAISTKKNGIPGEYREEDCTTGLSCRAGTTDSLFVGDTELYGQYEGTIFGSLGRGEDEGWMLQSERSDTSCIMGDSTWSTGVWIDCPDGKQRLVEPSILLLVDGCEQRNGLIHAAGDAIVSQLAAEFITAFMETKNAI